MFPTIAEYNQAIQSKGGGVFKSLVGLSFIPSRTRPVRIYSFGSGSYAVVFKARDQSHEFAIRCFISAEQENIDRYKSIDKYLKSVSASWIIKIDLLENEFNVLWKYYPVVKMEWVEGQLLNKYITQILNDNKALSELQEEIVRVSKSLEELKIGHGDIQCGNVIITKDIDGKNIIKLIDYDGMYIPLFSNKINLEKGRSEFQHPDRSKFQYNEKIDRFSFWVILCAIEALKFDKTLWKEVMEGGFNTLDNMLLIGDDFKFFNNSKLANRLYQLNQTSLSFYLNKLSKFCNSGPSDIEAPVLFDGSYEKEFVENTHSYQTDNSNLNVQIITNPDGAVILTSTFQRIGTTPLKLNKEAYLGRPLIITDGNQIKQIEILINSREFNIDFTESSHSDSVSNNNSQDTLNQRFKELKDLLDNGAINETEYQQLKKEVLQPPGLADNGKQDNIRRSVNPLNFKKSSTGKYRNLFIGLSIFAILIVCYSFYLSQKKKPMVQEPVAATTDSTTTTTTTTQIPIDTTEKLNTLIPYRKNDEKYSSVDSVTMKSKNRKEYDYASSFSEGLAFVRLNNKWGVIDKTGEIIIPLEYEKLSSFSEGLAAIQSNNKWGFIDKTGKIIIPFEYDGAGLFSEGLAGVELNGKSGFIDKTGKIIVPLDYNQFSNFSEELAGIKLNNKWGFIDKTGKIIVPLEYDNVGGFSQGLAQVELNDKWGFIDKTGKIIVPLGYDFVVRFSEGLAAVQLNGKYGAIDKTGKIIIPLEYEDFSSFSEGLAAVQLNNKSGFIDKTRKIIVPLEYDNVSSFSEGLAAVELNGKWGAIDKTGKIIVPLEYESPLNFSEGLATVFLNGKCGFIDKTGKIIVPF